MGRQFFSETLEQMQRNLTSIGTVVGGLAVFALLIAALGLFGMAVHVSSRRLREIAIRKALGAHTRQIVLLLLRDFSRPVVIANLIAAPLALMAGRLYLTLFIERVSITWAPFAWSLVATLLVAWGAVAQQILRAARVEPASVLQHE
jgi:putative ABC transport system permease protein